MRGPLVPVARPFRVLAYPSRVVARWLSIDSLPTLFNGEWIWVPARAWPGLWVRYESYIAGLLPRYLGHGGTFIDVGASFGLWSFK